MGIMAFHIGCSFIEIREEINKMYTKEELLMLAGKLAMSCEKVLQSDLLTFSDKLMEMKLALMEYDNAIMECVRETDKGIK